MLYIDRTSQNKLKIIKHTNFKEELKINLKAFFLNLLKLKDKNVEYLGTFAPSIINLWVKTTLGEEKI